MRLLFFPSLAYQLEHFRFFLFVEIGSQCSNMVNVSQSHTSLPALAESQLNDRQLVLLSYSNINVIEAVIDSQLQYFHSAELLSKFR